MSLNPGSSGILSLDPWPQLPQDSSNSSCNWNIQLIRMVLRYPSSICAMSSKTKIIYLVAILPHYWLVGVSSCATVQPVPCSRIIIMQITMLVRSSSTRTDLGKSRKRTRYLVSSKEKQVLLLLFLSGVSMVCFHFFRPCPFLYRTDPGVRSRIRGTA